MIVNRGTTEIKNKRGKNACRPPHDTARVKGSERGGGAMIKLVKNYLEDSLGGREEKGWKQDGAKQSDEAKPD